MHINGKLLTLMKNSKNVRLENSFSCRLATGTLNEPWLHLSRLMSCETARIAILNACCWKKIIFKPAYLPHLNVFLFLFLIFPFFSFKTF